MKVTRMLAAPDHVLPAGQSGNGTANPNTWITGNVCLTPKASSPLHHRTSTASNRRTGIARIMATGAQSFYELYRRSRYRLPNLGAGETPRD